MRRFPINLPDDELRIYLKQFDNSFESLLTLLNSGVFYAEATLAADLSSGNTVVISGKTYSGKAIRSGYKLPSGANIGGIWNGTNYTIIWCNQCEVVA